MIYLYVYLFIGLVFAFALGWECADSWELGVGKPRDAGDWFGYVSALLMCAVLWPMFLFLMWEPRR